MLKNKIYIPFVRFNPSTPVCPAGRRQPANPQTIFVLSFICLYSILFAQDEFSYDSKNKRNPFISLVTADGRILKLEHEEGVMGSLLLEGIIYDKHGLSYVIVNGEVFKVGDTVSGYQVLKIEKNKVIFIKDGQPTEVKLKEEEP